MQIWHGFPQHYFCRHTLRAVLEVCVCVCVCVFVCVVSQTTSYHMHFIPQADPSSNASALPAARAYHVVCLSRAPSIVLPFFLSLPGPEAIPVLMFGVNVSSVMFDHPAK